MALKQYTVNLMSVAHYSVYYKDKILKYTVVWLRTACYNTHPELLLLPQAEGKDQTKQFFPTQFPLYYLVMFLM